MKSKIINNLQKLENRDKFTHSDDDSHDGNNVDDGGDGAADDGAADDDILSIDSYNTEEEGIEIFVY
ncbi:unnamed protein product [Rhizophagus irregularis]|nr:unnamed protein product [Rhizophagus irregularis]